MVLTVAEIQDSHGCFNSGFVSIDNKSRGQKNQQQVVPHGFADATLRRTPKPCRQSLVDASQLSAMNNQLLAKQLASVIYPFEDISRHPLHGTFIVQLTRTLHT